MDFNILKKAGLKPADFSKLVKVHRVTVSLWVHKHNEPHHLLAARVSKMLDAVRAAVDAGDLPVSFDVPRRERALKIQRAVLKYIKH